MIIKPGSLSIKRCVLGTLVFAIVIAGIIFFKAQSPITANADARASVYYPLTAKVTGFSSESDMVFAESNDGNIWCFTGIEDWMIGDRCAMVMNDSGTPNDVDDDWIVAVRYFI